MTQSHDLQLLFLYQDPSKAFIVVLIGRTCCVQKYHITQSTQQEVTEGLKYGDNRGHCINV